MNTKSAKNVGIGLKADVVVVGSGLSGCSAAITAAREGATVVLVERGGLLGGLATNGLRSLFQSQKLDDAGNQRFGGISCEILNRVFDEQPIDLQNPPRCGVVFDEQRLKLVLTELLRESGVKVLSHTFSSDVERENGKLTGLMVEGKVGRQLIVTRAIVDASGTASVAHRATCPMEVRNPKVALGFKLGSIDVDAFVESQTAKGESAALMVRDWERRGVLCHQIALKALGNAGGSRITVYGLRGRSELIFHRDPTTIESMHPVALSREQMRQQLETYSILEELRNSMAGFAHATVVHNASMMKVEGARSVVSQAESWWESLRKRSATDQTGATISVINARPSVCRPEPLDAELGIPFDILLPQSVEGLYIVNPKALSLGSEGLLDCHDTAAGLGQAAGVAASSVVLNRCSAEDCASTTQNRLIGLGEEPVKP
jgi:2-polyprenyl-6-methoxyphenol hydroxylase-like FAD-dependent oxidoreductase